MKKKKAPTKNDSHHYPPFADTAFSMRVFLAYFPAHRLAFLAITEGDQMRSSLSGIAQLFCYAFRSGRLFKNLQGDENEENVSYVFCCIF